MNIDKVTRDGAFRSVDTLKAKKAGLLKEAGEMISRLVDDMQEAHDAHIYDEDDRHEKDCSYCATIKDARALLKKMGWR